MAGPLIIVYKVLTIFCKLGGPYVMPFIAPILAPIGWSILCCCCVSPLYWSMDPNIMNSTDKPDGGKEKSFMRSFSCGFLIYYPICVILLCIMARGICGIA